ncbi:MAG: TlpA disulfide reductase family protein [Candidatus Poribacteria bacterium]|nr:TlpA disulfide reductase family protein [Candidatus Poribacteria bacterium]
MFRSTSIFLVAFVLLCACFYGCGGDEVDEPDAMATDSDASNPIVPDPGDRPPPAPRDFGAAPAFQLEDLDGNQVALDDFQGQVVAINFWATWCAPCRREVPEFVEIQAEHQDRGFTILGISRDIEHDGGNIIRDEEAVQEFVEQFDVNYPILWDTENVYGDGYNGFGMPTTVILDRDHKIRFRHNGIVDKVTFEAEIEMLLNE